MSRQSSSEDRSERVRIRLPRIKAVANATHRLDRDVELPPDFVDGRVNAACVDSGLASNRLEQDLAGASARTGGYQVAENGPLVRTQPHRRTTGCRSYLSPSEVHSHSVEVDRTKRANLSLSCTDLIGFHCRG